MERLHQGPDSPLRVKMVTGGGWRVSQCFTFSQTNRLSDVIVFRDVLCVYEWMGWGWGPSGCGVFSEDYMAGREGGGGVVAHSNRTPLHIAYNVLFLFVLYIYFSFSYSLFVICQHLTHI